MLCAAAMNQLTKNLCCEWGPDGIRVNAVSPWYTLTPLAQQVLQDKEYEAKVLSRTPLKRVAQPDEVSGVQVILRLDNFVQHTKYQHWQFTYVTLMIMSGQPVLHHLPRVMNKCTMPKHARSFDLCAAGLVAFLSGAAGAYITGQNIAVDGGYSVMGMY